MKNYSKFLSFALIAIMVVSATSCSKHKGFKRDRKEDFYYKFYVENKDADQPEEGDIVDFKLTVRTNDSIIVSTFPTRDQIVESIFKGDLYAALRKMHVGDSASFILNGDSIFHYFFGQNYPFDTEPLYFDIKLDKIMTMDEFEEDQAERRKEYEEILEVFKNSEDSLLTNYLTENKVTVKPSSTGLYYIKMTPGKGKKIKEGSHVSLHYTGSLLDGTIFDSSYPREKPFELEVGKGQVIPGFDEALLLMQEGEKAKIIIPSKLAYGERGAGGVIPPYTPIVFEIEVLDVE